MRRTKEERRCFSKQALQRATRPDVVRFLLDYGTCTGCTNPLTDDSTHTEQVASAARFKQENIQAYMLHRRKVLFEIAERDSERHSDVPPHDPPTKQSANAIAMT
mmetsp:Transcript_26640/g.49779  ORF Transcript_26640/g.49779 Transcript_26640/m.49779 type:complete len:105 (-) Transcript_26640:178-492(-)